MNKGITVDEYKAMLKDGISREKFIELLEDSKPAVMIHILRNKKFPIDVLLDESFLARHASDPNYWLLQICTSDAKLNRRSEVIAYYRNKISDSEHMSDDMVLSVAGVSLGKVG
jgi:hypothetical protein